MPPDQPRPIFSREEVLEGLPARRASTLLFAIESRTAELVARSRVAMATFRTERTEAERERQFLAALAAGREPPLRPRIQDLERYAPRWAPLVPPGADLRAALARLLAAKYAFRRRDVPRIRAALGLDGRDVRDVHARLHDAPVDSVYARSIGPRERLRWLRSRVATRLEELPPFWTAFALTLTETVGGGVLALPIALAGVGQVGAVVLLVVFGLVNLLTIAALVEAITRNGSIRYGRAYFGRLVGDYLGPPGTISLSLALFVLSSAVLLVLAVGFGLTIAGATGIPPEVCAAVLFVVVFAIVRRESLDVTVASALVIGGINLALLLVISVIAASHLRPENLAAAPALTGSDAPVAVIGLVFGVVLASYFGHSSAANAAKVVLARDPSGRALLWGNLAAMSVVIGIYSIAVVTITGAVGSTRLLDYPGTAVTPLAEVAGPVISVLGVIYVALAMGLGSVHQALGLVNQVGEHLPRPDDTSRQGRLRTPAARTVARFLPLVVLFGVLEWLILTGRESFTGALGYIGALIVPILGGVFPMLMLAVSRRQGAYVPGVVLRAIGHPVTIVVVAGVYLGAVLAHGLVIWESPIERAAAFGASAVMLAVALFAIRRGGLRPRAILEIRQNEGADEEVTWGLTAAGRPISVELASERRSGVGAPAVGLDGRGGLGRLEDLRSVTLTVPAGLAQLDLWVHRVDATGDSGPLPVIIEVAPPDRGTDEWAPSGPRFGVLAAGTRVRIRFARDTEASAVPTSRLVASTPTG